VPLFLDQERILYELGGSIALVSLNGGRPTVLLQASGSERFAGFSVSGDGRELFAVRESAEGDVWLASW
jgi:hypothetical protein